MIYLICTNIGFFCTCTVFYLYLDMKMQYIKNFPKPQFLSSNIHTIIKEQYRDIQACRLIPAYRRASLSLTETVCGFSHI